MQICGNTQNPVATQAMNKNDFLARVIRYFTHHPLWLRLVEWSKTHAPLPGLKGIPLYNLVTFIDQETRDDVITTRANSMAFSLFMAIFPSIIVLFTLLPYTPLYEMNISIDGEAKKFQDVLRDNIKEVMPGEAGQMLFSTIEDIASKPRSGLLSFGFFLAIWFASNGMLSMMKGMEKSYNTFKKRTAFEKRLMAIQLTFLVGLVLVASVILVILGDLILHFVFQYVKVDLLTQLAFFGLRWVVVILLFYTLFSTIYRYGSSTRRRIPFFNSGAMLATLLSILTSWGFSFYVDNFGNYNTLYGSIGTLIVLMVWIQLNCMILLIGFELNAGIVVLREQSREKQGVEKEVE